MWSNFDLWWWVPLYDGRDCDMFGTMSEHRRELWAHLGAFLNQWGNYIQTLKDAWNLLDNYLGGCRHYLRLSGCTWAIDFPQQCIWCKGYSLLSLLNHTGCYLLQHCIFYLATLRKSNEMGEWFKHKCRNSSIPTKWLNDINQTWCRCHLVLAMGPGNPPVVQVQTAKMVRFCSRTIKIPKPLRLGGQNPDPYASTRGIYRVWLDLSVPIFSFVQRVSVYGCI